MKKEIQEYHSALAPEDKKIAALLAKYILEELPEADYKIWHRHPVWFLDGNPIVGYHKLKDSMRLLFWSGQSFDEEGLAVEGSFKAAEKCYNSVDEINVKDLSCWLKKSKKFQWDYKNIMKNKGLRPLKGV